MHLTNREAIALVVVYNGCYSLRNRIEPKLCVIYGVCYKRRLMAKVHRHAVCNGLYDIS